MSSDQRARPGAPRPGFDFGDIDSQATSKAWTRFLASRNAPSMPVTGVRSVIYQSWVRSNTTGVKPEQCAAPSLERGRPRSKSTYDQDELRRATRASLTQIGELLTGAEAMLILTDRDGVILETVGDNSTLGKAAKINLSVGGVWSEHASGTNGIGTALWTGQPVYVHGEEHFCEGMKAWSCAAAPIRDPVDQSIIGIINLSGLTTIFQKHNAAFAATAARDIEVALKEEQWLQNMQLMEAIIGKFPARAQEPTEGLAIVDRFGRLIFNRNTGLNMAQTDRDLGLGARFLELPDGITEEKIIASLPTEHGCQDVRLIAIDGEVRGAALVFAKPERRSPRKLELPPLPGLQVAGTDLKIVGRSEAILEALDVASRIATVNTPTLIQGQTGVGKELFARLIHSRMHPGKTQNFTAINCGVITPQMFRDGVLSPEADSSATGPLGPLCLDEIGELPAEMQPYLLRVLEERVPGPHGVERPSLRVLSLTNRHLLHEVEAGRFRRDLFYRISSIILKIPPLKQRGEDILLIAEHYNRKISAETGRDLLVLAPDVQEALLAHDWPGNVRELRNAIAGLHYLAKSRKVTLDDLPRDVTHPADPVPPTSGFAQELRLASAASLRHAEEMLVENALIHHQGNMSQAAKALGISRPTLYRKMQTYGIKMATKG